MRYTKKKTIFSPIRVMLAVAVIVSIIWWLIAQPTWQSNVTSSRTIDVERLRSHVVFLSESCHPRNWQFTNHLEEAAAYIGDHFMRAGARVENQPYEVNGKYFKNVSGLFGPETGPRIIIGAHYDSCADTPGADDNASGVAGLIELSYLLGQSNPSIAVELVAYSLEEPPFFRTEHMGSAKHAARIMSSNVAVTGVIVLEMIGYFDDARFSQAYPSALLYLMYPSRGNFIGVIGRSDQGDWIKKIKSGMKGATELPVYSIRAPASLPGIDYSDHLNYWAHGIPAVMITDTAFYRNRSYHKPSDTHDSLDYNRMRDVVISVMETVENLWP